MSLSDAMAAVLIEPLSSIVEARVPVRVGVVAGEWELPEPDRAALRTFGLPDGPLLAPGRPSSCSRRIPGRPTRPRLGLG